MGFAELLEEGVRQEVGQFHLSHHLSHPSLTTCLTPCLTTCLTTCITHLSHLSPPAGGFGRYQWLHVTLISLPGLMIASQNLLNNFVSGSPAHHCSLPTNHSSRYNLSHYQIDEKQLLRAFIPMDSSGSRLDRCRRFVEPQWQLLAANSSANVSQIPTEGCLDGWAYDRSEFLSTTVSEMIQTIYMGGVLTGAIVYGGLSDRYGRRSVLIWSYLQLGVLGCSSAFLPSYSTYCAFRFLSGMAVSGVILNGFSLNDPGGACLLAERLEETSAGGVSAQFLFFSYTWSVPFKIKASAPVPVLLPCLPFKIKPLPQFPFFSYAGQYLSKIKASAPVPVLLLLLFLFFSYSWWFSESARWLVLNRRSEDALKSLHRVARVNGKKDIEDTLTLEVLHSHMKKEMDSSRSTFTAYDLLRTRQMRRISICLLVVWFATSFAYYGLVMDLQKFGIQLIFGAMDFPAKLVALGMLQLPGETRLSGHLPVRVLPPTDMQTVRTTLACLGKCFTSASFTTVYLYTGSCTPPCSGLGFVSTMARVGSMAAPAVLILDEVLPALPSAVYGGAAVLASVFACFLPETLNKPLPDTIEDVEENGSETNLTPLQPEAGVALKEGVATTEGVALKELKEAEGSGLNAL
ncbi:Solute carrier family 22 member 6 [Dissostichus eleginoides]|uniref:Solute carrier family 22 member 6 n=1 Tax=Dissostichus eleginoides TaxID=100907 RepID=A0AAD9BNZ5_DISEL|nr:Solute carrier family 22 member 6 [Dissostichus eleginoides]